MPLTAGGCLGLALALAGVSAGRPALAAAGTALMTATLILAGAALVLFGIAGARHMHGGG